MESNAFIKPPEKIPFYLKIGLLISKMIVKKDLLALNFWPGIRRRLSAQRYWNH